MKYVLITSLSIGLIACTHQPKEKQLAKYTNEGNQILESFYKKTNDTIVFKRILTDGTTSKIQSGYIFLDDDALTHQNFSSVQQLPNAATILDSLRTQFKADGFAERIFKDRDVMFIQIMPDSTMNENDVSGFINLRHDIEEKIDEKLKTSNLGEWFAGDMGAGANMLFFVDDWNASMEIVMEVLKEEKLLDRVLITKRIATAKDEWNYEIVYPTEYQGIFNEI